MWFRSQWVFYFNICLTIILIYFLTYETLAITVCESFPSIENGYKLSKRKVILSSTHLIDVSVQYACNSGFVYSLNNSIVNCTEEGLKNTVGKCVEGNA